MRRIETRSRSGRIQWDEANLEENEKIKAEFSNIRVVEPKTPYHGPDVPDEGDDPHPFALEASDLCPSGSGMSISGNSCPSSNGDTAAGPSGTRRSHSGGASFTSSDGGELPGDEEQQSSRAKRRRFEAARRAHYNMRQALALGRELVTSEHDDEEEEVEGPPPMNPGHDAGQDGVLDAANHSAVADGFGSAGAVQEQPGSGHGGTDGPGTQL